MGLKKSLKKRLSVKHGGSKRNANNNITPIVGEESPTPSSAKFSSDKPLVDEVKVPPHDLPRTINTRKKNNNERDEVRDQAILQVQESMKDLRPYQIRPLTKQDKVLVMQLWNKALAFSTGFSEALTIYWRLACCADHQGDPMTLVEKNEDPLYFCIRDRMVDAETLVMGLLDSAIRSLCPGHQKVQREAYRPIQHDVIVERANGEFSLECQSLEDHFALFARLGVTPDYWVKFIGACHWAMSSHTPYAQDDDMENLEHGPVHSALSRTIAIYVAIPAINTFKELATLYQAPVVLKIQELWETFSEYGRADFGEIFYRKLLSEHPQLIDYFLKTDMDALALHLSMALDMVIKNVNAMGVANTMFRTALENLAEMHRKNNVPTYSYALVGATILECFQPIFEKEEEATKDSDDPVIASDLRAGLTKVYSEIMSVVYYPMLKQEKLVTKAQEFYEQVKEELQWTDDQLHSRMMQIEEEIQMTGTYIQTTEELEMGARLAWRNSAKCVGRIAWDTLQIRDCRHISDPNDMFDEMREHLLAATAGTNIQSVMTVFKPKNPSELFGIRWWSAQLVRYAAYKNILTGEIVGDPANLELTEYLTENNLWEPPQPISSFDVLPLVLKVPGRKVPIVKALPSDCIFEVILEHPTLSTLSELELRWTTIPAISNFKMDLGGVVYQNMPFNGWFVSTEIVRNLIERYDVGPQMANAIGLDMENDVMWRQTVSCELERMVIYSFKKHKFTIVDPMTVGRSFCAHVQREREQYGRECPAQWSWIGGLLGPTNPTWHLEMRDFLVLPQYEYCAEDRLLHCVKSLADDTDTRIGTSVTDLSENVSVFSLDEHVESPHVLILYGSQTGNAESAARRLKRELRLTKPTMMCLNEAKGLKDLQKNKITHVLAVCSTFGNGNPPANATEFFDTEIVGNFPGKKFAILGLGSSIYPKFCQAGEGLEKLFLQNRFESITPLTKADEAAGADGTIADWIAMMKAIILPPNVERALRNSIGLELDDKPPIHKIEWLAKDKAENFIQPVLDSAITSLCVSNDELLENSDHRSIRKISFCTPTPYESGDHLSVMPQNSMAMVNRFLRCFETELVLQCSTDSIEYNHSEDLLTEIANRPFDILALEGSRSTKADVFFQTPTTLSHALKTTLDLSLGSKDVIDLLYLVKRLLDDKTEAITRDDRESLMNFQDMQRFLVVSQTIFDADSDNRTQAIDKFISSYPTMVDFLDSFKELLLQPFFDDTPVLRIADILSTLNRLQPRFYSISSSNKVSPDVVAITVGVLREKTSKGVMINGVCSNYLASLRRGEDQAIIQVHKSSFRLPSDPQSSIIMVGAGTGLSPMMGFLADKALDKDQGAAGGIIHLFFGCRTMQDLIYKEEIEEYEAEGLICFHHALSRGPGPKTYVQDKIKQLGIEAADLLLRKDTHYYVCGDARMANSCYEYCVDVLRKHAGKSRVGAAHYLKQMQAQGRWQTDVWGIVSNYENAKKLVMNSKRTAAKIWLQQFEN